MYHTYRKNPRISVALDKLAAWPIRGDRGQVQHSKPASAARGGGQGGATVYTLILDLVSGGTTRLDHFTSRQQAEMSGIGFVYRLPMLYADWHVYETSQVDAQKEKPCK
jgi:hypothetical protein